MIERAQRRHAAALATLHRSSLPSSLLSTMGHATLVRYYAFASGSSRELVLAAVEGDVVGGCVLTYEPGTLLGRFVAAGRSRFAADFARAFVRDRDLRRRLWWRLRQGGSDDAEDVPEITQIFTDARLRGRGIGRQLLRSCEEALRVAGHSEYIIHTQRDDNDAGIRFYRREGFTTVAETRSFGEWFLVMKKAVP